MLEFFQWVFSNFWTWLGFLIYMMIAVSPFYGIHALVERSNEKK
jgi:hypothetical protein